LGLSYLFPELLVPYIFCAPRGSFCSQRVRTKTFLQWRQKLLNSIVHSQADNLNLIAHCIANSTNLHFICLFFEHEAICNTINTVSEKILYIARIDGRRFRKTFLKSIIDSIIKSECYRRIFRHIRSIGKSLK